MITTLNDATKLAHLLHEFEAANSPKFKEADNGFIISVPSHDVPQLRNMILVPTDVPSGILDRDAVSQRDKWTHDFIASLDSSDFDLEHVAFYTFVIPVQQSIRIPLFNIKKRSSRVLFISAVDYLWEYRLRIGVRTEREESALQVFPKWNNNDEEQFITPAITTVTDNNRTEDIAELLQQNRPELSNGLYIVYGPGGIGKTYFLRRTADRYVKRWRIDPTQGIPAFVSLPALLHKEALENYLSNRSPFKALTLHQIRSLIKYGVIVPFLDAFDELIRGEIREGCKQFLASLDNLMAPHGIGVLTSRDYFLYVDPLIPGLLRGKKNTYELWIGYFNDQGRRSFIRQKTDLPDSAAGRWAKALEREVHKLGLDGSDVDSLVGHPLILDAFCSYIRSLPPSEMVVTADRFKFTTPDVFSEIVMRILERESDKARPGWDKKFEGKFGDSWEHGPFSPDLQRMVLTELSLRSARQGGEKRQQDNSMQEWTHALFDLDGDRMPMTPEEILKRRKRALKHELEDVLGEPRFSPQADLSEHENLREQAYDEITDFYMQHVLAYTEPSAPPDMIFSVRHRTYFEYFVAQGLLNGIKSLLEQRYASTAEELIEWSWKHHIFDMYSGCFEFLLWDRQIMDQGPEVLRDLFDHEKQENNDFTSSYFLSLGLTLFLRRHKGSEKSAEVAPTSFAEASDWNIELMQELLPVISRLNVNQLSFPNLLVSGDDNSEMELSDITLVDCEFNSIALRNCNLRNVKLEACVCNYLRLRGKVTFSNCTLRLSEVFSDGLLVDSQAKVWFDKDCVISESLRLALVNCPASVRLQLKGWDKCSVISDEDVLRNDAALSKGERFLHKLMALVRRHGKDTWGVFSKKLSGRTGTDNHFQRILTLLQGAKIIEMSQGSDIIRLSADAEQHMFDGKRREGRKQYEDEKQFWEPIANELDRILAD